MRFLVIATEWSSGHGGLSTFNRQLCCALVRSGHEVQCVVSTASTDDLKDASESGVGLVFAPKVIGGSAEISLFRRPTLPQEWLPDVIVGHGRITGPAAQALQADYFPRARRAHFIHMAPDEIEWLKLDRRDDPAARAEERTGLEIKLAAGASLCVTVGPRLHGRFCTDFHANGYAPPFRFDPGFDGASPPCSPPPGTPWHILVLGRAEDDHLKGLDLAAAALGKVISRRSPDLPPLELRVRGSRPDTAPALRQKLQGWAGSERLRVHILNFTDSVQVIEEEFRRASLVLMPSRSEGYGLVGHEAIIAGVPVLISDQSGLAGSLREVLTDEQYEWVVFQVTGSDIANVEVMARAIERQLADREAAFQRAKDLRDELAINKQWTEVIDGFVGAVRASPEPLVLPQRMGLIGSVFRVGPATDDAEDLGRDLGILAADPTYLATVAARIIRKNHTSQSNGTHTLSLRLAAEGSLPAPTSYGSFEIGLAAVELRAKAPEGVLDPDTIRETGKGRFPTPVGKASRLRIRPGSSDTEIWSVEATDRSSTLEGDVMLDHSLDGSRFAALIDLIVGEHGMADVVVTVRGTAIQAKFQPREGTPRAETGTDERRELETIAGLLLKRHFPEREIIVPSGP